MPSIADEQRNRRFWTRVLGGPGCWLWQASVDSVGYGIFKAEWRLYKAHRYAYELCIGPIPDGMCVCHHCDVRRCVNPTHLFIASHKENMMDMAAKGRATNGPHSKLTGQDVITIRDLAASGYSYVELSGRFGVSDATIASIVHRKTWKHIA